MQNGHHKGVSGLLIGILFISLPIQSTNAPCSFHLYNIENPQEDHLLYGKVTDKLTREPMIGVTIRIEGENTGVITDTEGNYRLILPSKDATILFSYIGYETRKIKLSKGKELNIQLVEATESIGEVIVTGYNLIQKESFTGNSTKIEKEELLRAHPNNLIAAIQTFDPSFRIQENLAAGSDPNTLPDFVLRGQTGIGQTTIDQNNASLISKEVLVGNSNLPIFVLDGFEVDVTKIYDLDINSIHSINILKDAAATAMYGSRAANGVIVVERRAPEAGRFRVQYTGGLSLDAPDLSSYNLMTASEKLEAERLAGLYDSSTPEVDPYTNAYYQRLNNVLQGVDTYWLSQGLQTALSHKHSIFVDGGENDVRWGVELGYKGTEGIMKHSDRDNTNGAFYVDYRFGGWQIKNKVSFSYNKSNDVPFNTFSDYSHLLPYQRLYDAKGNYVRRLENFAGYSGTLVNPLYEVNFYQSFDRSNYTEVADDLSLNWHITGHLKLRGQFSVLMRNSESEWYRDPASASYSSTTAQRNGDKRESTQKMTIMDGSLSLLYNNSFNGHNLNLCLSANARQELNEAHETNYRGFPGGDLISPNYAAEINGKPSSLDNKTRMVGGLLTANYTFRNIYLADLTGRMDGSSEFGADRRWSTFWAAGAGINLHHMEWLKNHSVVSLLKVRSSYGLTGKTNFSLFSAKDMYRLQTDSWYPTGYGVFLYQKGNPDLKWERKYTLDLGAELGLWEDKVYLKASYYNERTVDLITDYTLPSSSGFTSYKENMGKIKNTGIELDMRVRVYRDKNWMVQLYGNFSHNKNEILEISQAMKDYNKKVEELFKDFHPGSTNNAKFSKTYLKYYEGASLTSIYGMKSLGISPTNGKEIFVRRNGDVTDVWSPDEWTVIGDAAPKGQGSFGCNLTYKQFSLFTSFMYSFGGDAYNHTLVQYVENADIRNSNVDRRVLYDRWQKPGDVTTMKDIRDRNLTTGASSRFVQRNNTLEWTSMTVGYDFTPQQLKKTGISGLYLSLSMNNLFHWSTIRQERGLDYPFARSFNLNTNIKF